MALGEQMKLVANDVQVVIVKDAGHWILEEQPKQTSEAIVKFL
jgi:pimeloyl-ACP methyl ester carboxylesterase